MADDFYQTLPTFHGFDSLMDPDLYRPVPDDWIVGMTDVVMSTQAIAEGRYKTVNTVGAAVVAAVGNALGRFDFPFVFGGDGASFALPGEVHGLAARALAETSAWARDEFKLTLRAALADVSAVRTAGFDLRVARYAPSPHVSYAMFAGGAMGWLDASMKAGHFAVPAGGPGARPNLDGLSCRWNQIAARRGLMLSVIVIPRTAMEEFRKLVEDILMLAADMKEAGHPLPPDGPDLAMSWGGIGIEAGVARRRREPAFLARLRTAARAFVSRAIVQRGKPFGGFDPARYRREVVENTDFRKYDDGLRMTLDCTPAMAARIEERLATAQREGVADYGIHRQAAALLTCIVPSALSSDHVHFVDGADGGYAAAARRLKEARLASTVQPI